MSSLLALLNLKAGDADQPRIREGAKHRRSAEPIKEPTQAQGIFNFESAPESFGVGSESLQSNVAVKGCVGRILLSEATYFDVSAPHISSLGRSA